MEYCNHNGLQRLGLSVHYEVVSCGIDRIINEILDQFESVIGAHIEVNG